MVMLSFTHLAVQPPVPETWNQYWNWDPLFLLALLLPVIFYARGVRALWRRAGRGRGVSYGRVAAFSAGMLVLFVALVSPVDALGEALLSAHMVQHLLLILVAAPLLVAGLSPVAAGWAIPRSGAVARWWRRRTALRRVWSAISHPATVWLLQLVALWLWHLPALYQAALMNESIHILEHLTFLAAALLFWWTLLWNRSLSHGAGTLFVFTTMLHSGLLGALLTFSQEAWYPLYNVTAYAWNMTPLSDQQLAGVIMWWPASLIYLAAMLAQVAAALRGSERRLTPRRVVTAPPARPELHQ